MMSPTLWFRQLFALLQKNLLLKISNPAGTLAEIFIPVGFMLLLVYFKSLSSELTSPNVAFSCGQALPWQSFEAEFLSGDPLVCYEKPAQCNVSGYYKSPQTVDGTTYFTNYGYTASAFGAGYPGYSLQIGDDIDYPPLAPDQEPSAYSTLTPSPSIKKLLEMLSLSAEAGENFAKFVVSANTTNENVTKGE